MKTYLDAWLFKVYQAESLIEIDKLYVKIFKMYRFLLRILFLLLQKTLFLKFLNLTPEQNFIDIGHLTVSVANGHVSDVLEGMFDDTRTDMLQCLQWARL